MEMADFTSTLIVDATPKQAFDAIVDVGRWWSSDLKGNSHALNDEFEVRFGDVHYSKQKVVELIPEKRVVWRIAESRLTFIQDQKEWTGTQIVFDISLKGNQTQIRLTHVGLTLTLECYEGCSVAWGLYLRNSLACLIKTGKGQPGFPPERPCA